MARPVSGLTTPRTWLAELRGRVRSRAARRPGTWWLLLSLGVASAAAGAAMLVWPALALRTLAAIIGGWLLVAGVLRLGGALLDRSPPHDRQRWSALVGVVCVAAGFACLGDPDTTLGLLALILGLQWLIGGIVDVVNGLRSDAAHRRWLVALGALSGVAGAVFLAWPVVSLLAFNVLAAVAAVGIGVLDVTAGLRLRKRRYQGEG